MLLENGTEVQTKSPLMKKVATTVGVGIIVAFAAVMGGIFYFANAV